MPGLNRSMKPAQTQRLFFMVYSPWPKQERWPSPARDSLFSVLKFTPQLQKPERPWTGVSKENSGSQWSGASSLTTALTTQMLEHLPALNSASLEAQHTLHAASRQGQPYAHLCQKKALSLLAHFLGMTSSSCSTPHFLTKSHLSSSRAAWICHPTGRWPERVGRTLLPPSAQFLALVVYTRISTHLNNIWELTDFNCLMPFSPYPPNQ